MNKTISISEFLPRISTEQEHKIRELAQIHQDYIDSILEHAEYSFEDYLSCNRLGELSDFYNELDEMGVGFGCSAKTQIMGCKEITLDNASKSIRYEWFTLVE